MHTRDVSCALFFFAREGPSCHNAVSNPLPRESKHIHKGKRTAGSYASPPCNSRTHKWPPRAEKQTTPYPHIYVVVTGCCRLDTFSAFEEDALELSVADRGVAAAVPLAAAMKPHGAVIHIPYAKDASMTAGPSGPGRLPSIKASYIPTWEGLREREGMHAQDTKWSGALLRRAARPRCAQSRIIARGKPPLFAKSRIKEKRARLSVRPVARSIPCMTLFADPGYL